jgi:L-ascorbate metabolism protein UlaG (beta-lactamase superfamily)
MKITWYGHACFRIEGEGVSIVTDPYTPEVAGLDPVDEPADVVVMSSATDRFHDLGHTCATLLLEENAIFRFEQGLVCGSGGRSSVL